MAELDKRQYIDGELRSGYEREGVVFTPELFYSDNHGKDSAARRREWEHQKNWGQLPLISACSDARGLFLPNAFYWRSIANGDDPSNYPYLIKEANCAVAIAHYAGDKVKAGQSPTGCGGEAELRKLLDGGEGTLGAHEYVSHSVQHYDPLMDAIHKAFQMARYTDKPVLAAIQDHITGFTKPVAAITHDGGVDRVVSAVPTDEIFAAAHQGSFNAERVYETGIPTLPIDRLVKPLRTFLEQQQEYVEGVQNKIPNLARLQQVQNPSLIYVSQDTRPGKVKYPGIMDVPGRVFAVRVPRRIEKFGDDEFEYPPTEDMVEKLMQQLSYPLAHALEHWGETDRPFGLSNTLFLEVRSPDSLGLILDAVKGTDLGRQFISKEDSTIIAGYIRNGELYNTEKIK